MDQFKLVNDTCGHPAGDQLLKQITGVLQSRVRSGDTLARLGGDEFGILLQSCSLDQALRIAESLRQAIRDYRFIWQDGVLAVGVSIGIVEITSDTPTVASVMSAADVACYSAKDLGRNRVQLYKPDDVPERHREMHWVSKLTRACDESRFELFYQPIVPIGASAARARTLRADAAPARRVRRPGDAGRIHSGRGALQRHALHRPLGGAPGARSGGASHRVRRQALHDCGQSVGHLAQR